MPEGSLALDRARESIMPCSDALRHFDPDEAHERRVTRQGRPTLEAERTTPTAWAHTLQRPTALGAKDPLGKDVDSVQRVEGTPFAWL